MIIGALVTSLTAHDIPTEVTVLFGGAVEEWIYGISGLFIL
jgi:hypothetical protein